MLWKWSCQATDAVAISWFRPAHHHDWTSKEPGYKMVQKSPHCLLPCYGDIRCSLDDCESMSSSLIIASWIHLYWRFQFMGAMLFRNYGSVRTTNRRWEKHCSTVFTGRPWWHVNGISRTMPFTTLRMSSACHAQTDNPVKASTVAYAADTTSPTADFIARVRRCELRPRKVVGCGMVYLNQEQELSYINHRRMLQAPLSFLETIDEDIVLEFVYEEPGRLRNGAHAADNLSKLTKVDHKSCEGRCWCADRCWHESHVVRVTLMCLYKCTVVLLAGFVIENLESSPKFMSYICINQF